MGKSRLENGVIIPPTHLELIVVDHCNITCRACNHASPAMPSWFADPDTVHRDFSLLAKYYRPRIIKVIGGEPLMHKQLGDVIQAARATGISRHFTLVTNGALLHKASDAVWEHIDEVEISRYPGVADTERNLPLAREKARAFGKKLTVCDYQDFRATFSLQGSADSALIAKVYAACKIAHVWGCHAVRDGHFHKCPQSIYTPMLTGGSDPADRIALVDGDDFQNTLLDFVNSPRPLSACAHCAGTVGRQETHALPARAQWREHIDQPLEALIDYDWLERSLITQDEFDDCKIPARPANTWPKPAWLKPLLRAILPVSDDPRSWRHGQRPTRQSAAEARERLAARKAEQRSDD